MCSWVDEIEKALSQYVDQGRSVEKEAKEIHRDIVEVLARRHLSDKVVFCDTGTFPIQKKQEFEVDDDYAPPGPEDPLPLELLRDDDSDEQVVRGYSGAYKLPEDFKKMKSPQEKGIIKEAAEEKGGGDSPTP